MSNINEPITIFSTVLAFPYLSLEESFCTKPIDADRTLIATAMTVIYATFRL
jgi:hypothetical protein